MHKNPRVFLLDELRGLAVLLMIFYHGAYDAVYIFRFTGSEWFTSAPMAFLQRYIAVSFILIAGIMGRYSRSNFRRGIKTFLCGMLVTAVTMIAMPSERILFGILHFLGAAMMLLGLCEPLLRRIPALVGMLISGILYLATDSIGRGWIGLGTLLPWIFLFLAGFWLGEAFYRRRMPDFCYREHLPALGWVGRHALPIYLAHQPVVYGVLWIANKLI